MRLNPLKCAFAMEAEKFLGFMITQRGVKANPEKCEVILRMNSLGCVKDVQRLAGRLTALFHFLGALAAKALPFFNFMKKGIVFEWTSACEEAFNYFKSIISAPPILGKPRNGEALFLYLAVIDEALATVLVATVLPRTPDNRQNGPSDPPSAAKARPGGDGSTPETPNTRWKLHVDGAYNQTFGEAGIILESPTGVVYEQSIKFDFPVSNNQAEYEALLGGLQLAREVGATRLEVCSDSQVITSQVNGMHQARESLLQKYLERVKKLKEDFDDVTVQHVPRERNTRADLLSKLASKKQRTDNRSLIQCLVKEPTVTLHLTQADPSWIGPITDFLESGKLPNDEKTAKALRRKAAKYTIIQGQLFKKGLNQPLLKCLRPDQTDYVLSESMRGAAAITSEGRP
ncbi:uncharacterized protein [Arachis hypogaea]|uniref:uncharacterized protein n=1 Tax=Arachis hypogaea TaxID=3818 RepID=UPI003B216F52